MNPPPAWHRWLSEVALRSTLCNASRIFWRIRLVNPEALPIKGPCFLYGNHSHNLDPFFINAFMPWGAPTSGVLTAEYMKKGALAFLFKGIGLLPTRKEVPEPHLIRAIYRKLDRGEKLVIYPEGGRRWAGLPAPWIAATAKIFVKCGVPVYPIRTHGSYVAWPRWATYPRPARVEIEVGQPLTFSRSTPMDEALLSLRAPIDLDENIVPDHIKPRWAYRPADGIHRLLYRDPETGQFQGLTSKDGYTIAGSDNAPRYVMAPDSTLNSVSSEDVTTTGALYQIIKQLPLEVNNEGYFFENEVVASTDHGEGMSHAEVAHIWLYADHIVLKTNSSSSTIPLEDILYTGIERNYKLQLTCAQSIYQFSFTGSGSALQWKDSLSRLKAVQQNG